MSGIIDWQKVEQVSDKFEEVLTELEELVPEFGNGNLSFDDSALTKEERDFENIVWSMIQVWGRLQYAVNHHEDMYTDTKKG